MRAGLIDLAILLGTAAAMEPVAWAVHRYVMHGWGWRWHRSHHLPRDGLFERNDLYAVCFTAVALVMIFAGRREGGALYWAGAGMALYGALYFFLHDGLVHRRWPLRMAVRNAYLRRLVQAHRLHHAVSGRTGAVSFGFLYAPPVEHLRRQLQSHGVATDR